MWKILNGNSNSFFGYKRIDVCQSSILSTSITLDRKSEDLLLGVII